MSTCGPKLPLLSGTQHVRIFKEDGKMETGFEPRPSALIPLKITYFLKSLSCLEVVKLII